MHVFCLILRKSDAAPRRGEIDAVLHHAARSVLPFPLPPGIASGHRWASADGAVLFYGWSRFGPEGVFHVDPDGGFAALDGWIGPAPSTAAEIYPRMGEGTPRLGDATGEYLAVAANRAGHGAATRNMTGAMPLYVAETADIAVVSNRAAIAALLTAGAAIDHDPLFHAVNIATGWQLADRTMHQGVRAVPPGHSVQFSPRRCDVAAPATDPWFSPALMETYRSGAAAYWDALFAIMCDTVRDLVTNAARRGPVTMRLSGGKDSRLLLAFLLGAGVCGKIEVFGSSGDPGNADAEVARRLAARFDLPFARRSRSASATGIDTKLGDHIFLTEAAISPYDLCWHPRFDDKGTVLAGHEAGLRNGARITTTSIADFEVWLTSHHQGFDALGVLRPDVAAQVRQVAQDIVLNAAWPDTPPENLPTWHRLTARMARWVAVVQSFEAVCGFAPHALAVDLPIISQYTLGEDVRRAEVFHYEMMVRADPWLAHTCPFANQVWAPELSAYVEPFAAPPPVTHQGDGAPGMPASTTAFLANRDVLFDWLLADTTHPLFELVDADRLRALAPDDITDARRLQSLWQVIQSRVVLDLDDLTGLAPWDAGPSPLDFPALATGAAAPLARAG